MLFKKIFAASAALVAVLLLAAAPLIAISAPGIMAQGTFSNGAQVLWKCQDNIRGIVQILLVTPDGQKYQADLFCGEGV